MALADVFETTLQKTNDWLRHIMRSLGWDRQERAYLALRAVLHTLRDRLSVIEAAHLGAQLPMLIRGVYYEGWTPLGKPVKWHREEFLACVWDHFRQDPDIDPERIVRAVVDVMVTHIDPGEMRKICGVLPAEFSSFLPAGALA